MSQINLQGQLNRNQGPSVFDIHFTCPQYRPLSVDQKLFFALLTYEEASSKHSNLDNTRLTSYLRPGDFGGCQIID